MEFVAHSISDDKKSDKNNEKIYTKITQRGAVSLHNCTVVVAKKGLVRLCPWKDVGSTWMVLGRRPCFSSHWSMQGIARALTLFGDWDEDRGQLQYFAPKGNTDQFVRLRKMLAQQDSRFGYEATPGGAVWSGYRHQESDWSHDEVLGFWYVIACVYGVRKENDGVLHGYKVAIHIPSRFGDKKKILADAVSYSHRLGWCVVVSDTGSVVQGMLSDYGLLRNRYLYDETVDSDISTLPQTNTDKSLAIQTKIATYCVDDDLSKIVNATLSVDNQWVADRETLSFAPDFHRHSGGSQESEDVWVSVL